MGFANGLAKSGAQHARMVLGKEAASSPAFDAYAHALGPELRASLGGRAYPLVFGEDHTGSSAAQSAQLAAALPRLSAVWPAPPTCRFAVLTVVREPYAWHLGVWSFFKHRRRRHPSWLHSWLPCLERPRNGTDAAQASGACPMQVELAFPVEAFAARARQPGVPLAEAQLRPLVHRPHLHLLLMERLAESFATHGALLGLPSMGAMASWALESRWSPRTDPYKGAAATAGGGRRTLLDVRERGEARFEAALRSAVAALQRVKRAAAGAAGGARVRAPTPLSGVRRRLAANAAVLPSRLDVLARHKAEMAAEPDAAATRARIERALADDRLLYSLASARLDDELRRLSTDGDACFAPEGMSAAAYVGQLRCSCERMGACPSVDGHCPPSRTTLKGLRAHHKAIDRALCEATRQGLPCAQLPRDVVVSDDSAPWRGSDVSTVDFRTARDERTYAQALLRNATAAGAAPVRGQLAPLMGWKTNDRGGPLVHTCTQQSSVSEAPRITHLKL